MTILRTLGATASAAALSGLFAASAPAQSLLSARGLGLPLEALDARARALGGLTVGLPEPHMSAVNPAAAMGLPAAGVTVTFHGDQIESVAGGQTTDFSTARFPVVQAAFPLGERFVATVGYAALLDQNWAARREDSLDVAGTRLQVIDRFRSSGGVGRLRAGAGYRLLPRLDVGAAVDVYTGVASDTVCREFPGPLGETGCGLTSGVPLLPSVTATTYEWEGLGLSAGARWRGEAFSASAAVAGGGMLRAEPQDSGIVGRDYPIPWQLDGGVSARISQQSLVAVSARWVGWSAANDELQGSGGARDAVHVAGGLEYDGLRLIGLGVPLRVGGRVSRLPFRWDDNGEFPDERALTGGLGIRFAGGAAVLDLSGERGWRGGEAAMLDESFWRISASLSLLGR